MRAVPPILLFVVGALMPGQARAQDADAAFLFSYRLIRGQESQFFDGYRRHLEWHSAKEDSLPWIGWTVVAGPGLGLFVDGTFGISPQAFDARVDPQGDGVDATQNLTPYGDPVYRYVYQLRRDLSTHRYLEERQPGPMQAVYWVDLHPGGIGAFEEAVERIKEAGVHQFALYERRAGGPHPSFLLAVQIARWADLGRAAYPLLNSLLRGAGTAVARVESEVWAYRPDLTYFP